MTLLGKAIVAIWNDITQGGREVFIEWHNREHIPERVAIPGFLRGRRYRADEGAPEYFTLYEARDSDVLVGADYLERLNNPTPWTKEATAHFRNTVRGVCTNVFSAGTGDGVAMVTMRFDASPDRAEALRSFLSDELLPSLVELGGICGVHLSVADQSASGLETAERKGRQVDVPNWIVMAEGSSGDAARIAGERLIAADLVSRGALEIGEFGLYRFEFGCVDAIPLVSDSRHRSTSRERSDL